MTSSSTPPATARERSLTDYAWYVTDAKLARGGLPEVRTWRAPSLATTAESHAALEQLGLADLNDLLDNNTDIIHSVLSSTFEDESDDAIESETHLEYNGGGGSNNFTPSKTVDQSEFARAAHLLASLLSESDDSSFSPSTPQSFGPPAKGTSQRTTLASWPATFGDTPPQTFGGDNRVTHPGGPSTGGRRHSLKYYTDSQSPPTRNHASLLGCRSFVPSPAAKERAAPLKEMTRSSALTEFRAGRLRLTSLFQIKPHIAEFARDQAGGRFVQQRLAEGSSAERQLARSQLQPCFRQLVTDAVGNHVIQKLFEIGTPEETHELFEAIRGDILRYTLHAYGCRVLQKALHAIPLVDALAFAEELHPHVIRCVEDQNGNHVIQKCVERLPYQHVQFVLNAFRGQVARVATHCYGCRVVQRILEHSPHCQSTSLLEEIRNNFVTLAQDQYGNYVIQHVLRFGQQSDREFILTQIVDNLLLLASHKFSSNVVERCMELKVAPDARRRILKAAFGQRNDPRPPIMSMIRDPYANYVVQRILDVNCDELGDELADDVLMRLEKHLPALRKFTYGKHIAAALERLRKQLQDRSSSLVRAAE